MAKRSPAPLLGRILKKVAPRMGAKVLIEPVWNIVGQITYKSGRRRYFRYSSIDLNPLGAAEVARDKDYANFFMEKLGYPIVPGSRTFYDGAWAEAIGAKKRGIDDAYRHAQKLGLPVIVKPNSGSQGVRVALVHTKREFYRAMRAIFRRDNVALVQRALRGKDYRVVVLDGKVISAYERIPLSVTGDGRSTIEVLLAKKQRQFVREGRDTKLRLKDPRIKDKLARRGMTLRSKPARGERIFLLDNANLSAGGDAVDVTGVLHKGFIKAAAQLTKDMGLRFCGVDLMVEGDITQAPTHWWVIEINAAPGLDHYVLTGKRQQKIVEDMYLQVLRSMEKGA